MLLLTASTRGEMLVSAQCCNSLVEISSIPLEFLFLREEMVSLTSFKVLFARINFASVSLGVLNLVDGILRCTAVLSVPSSVFKKQLLNSSLGFSTVFSLVTSLIGGFFFSPFL